jgi:serine/threonine-protein kinase
MGYVELCFRRESRFLRWSARKRLHEQYRSDARFRSMFMDEARLAGLVRHPNVVGVTDVGEDQDGPYLIMDYVEGVSLARAIREMMGSRLIPIQVAVRICIEVAMGLHAAHEVRSEDGSVLHLVHRDVSPQNILIGFDGTVRVTDFGIAKALGNVSQTNAGVLKGNMGYLSPEQLRFEEPDRRSDFFSLGVTLYELLSGVRLYPNTSGFDGTRRILVEPPPDIGEVRSDVPPALVELLFELLSKDRVGRPSTGLEIATRLEGILAVLIDEEGSVTVSDYMDEHFALQREQHRAFLAEHLKRVDAETSLTRSIPPVTLPPERRGSLGLFRGARYRFDWLLLCALAAVWVIAIVAHRAATSNQQAVVNSTALPAQAPPSGSPPSGSPPPIVPVQAAQVPASALPPVEATKPVAPPAVSASDEVTNTGTSSARQKARAHQAARARLDRKRHRNKQSAQGADLAVPLFTQWR